MTLTPKKARTTRNTHGSAPVRPNDTMTMQHDFPARAINNHSAHLRFDGFPFERMTLGHYFEVPMEEIRKAVSHCGLMAQDSGRHFATRKLADGSRRIMRIV